jgi:hypothetical protein
MPEANTPLVCFDRVVPPEYQPARAVAEQVALRSFAAVRGPRIQNIGLSDLRTIDPSKPIGAARMAVIDVKKWENGRTLACRFLDGDATQKKKVQDKAHIWEQFANVKFKFVDSGDAEIRISFSADPGSWSAVGTDCLVERYFPKYQPTMNFGWLRDDTDDVEYERVVVHEFGHALGCIHEHQSPTATLQWDTAAVYRTFSGPPNFWSRDDIDFNILQKYSPEGVSATRFDETSIMLYQFDKSLFLNGQGTPLNTHLSDQDKQMISQMYPMQG